MSIFSAEVLNKENAFDLGATIHIIINEFANLYTRHKEPSQDIKSEKIQQHMAVFEAYNKTHQTDKERIMEPSINLCHLRKGVLSLIPSTQARS